MEMTGLTDKEVELSRQKYGDNRLSAKKRKSFFASFLESFGDPLIKILLAALAVNIILLFRDASWFESIAIALAILLATLVSTLSEYGSESAFEKLQEQAAKINCRIIRNNNLVQLPVQDIVIGDVVLLQPGDRIPADGVIIKGKLDVDQSSLNGESKEAKKIFVHSSYNNENSHYYSQSENKNDLLDKSLLFSGTIVCAGEALMRVTKIGDETFYGKIGTEIQEKTRESPLKLRLGKLASSIGKFGYIAAIFTMLAYLLNVVVFDNNFDQELIFAMLTQPKEILPHLLRAATLAVTVVVMAVPEGLPMMITVVLSANMKRMLKDSVLVRKLVGIETAGSLNILFSDKTGTLTKGKLDVTHFITGLGEIWTKTQTAAKNNKLREILHDSINYNNAAFLDKNKAIGGNATDRASLEFVSKFKYKNKQIKKGNIVPFNGELKYMATTITGDMNAVLIKGAPEKLLPYCTHYYDDDGKVNNFMNKHKIDGILKEFASQAIRLIVVALADNEIDIKDGFRNLKLVGLLGIRDEIRKEAVQGVRQVQNAGIQTVMITGDSQTTAHAIAKDTGILRKSSDVIISSDGLNKLSDQELTEMLPNLRVVARALPGDKSRLVRIAQNKGLVVGMTGDGVNDAPALKQADIGFAMGSGTEVAKEAGDIVILDDNFNSISKAICYGRAIFKSIRKFIIYQMSICMCAVGVTVLAPFFGVDFPITVIQMLWINIVMDTLAGLAFSGEKARKKYMEEPPKKRDEPMMNGYMKGQIAVSSIYTTILCLFFLKSPVFYQAFEIHGYVYQMTAFFALFMFIAIFTSFCARTHQINLFEYLAANKAFITIMALITVIQIFIIYFGGSVFRTAGLEFNDMILIILLAMTIIPIDLLRKFIIKKNVGRMGT